MAERYGDELAAELPEVDQVAGFGQAFNVTPAERDGTEVPKGAAAGRKLIPASSTPLPEFDLLNLPRPKSAVPWAYVKIAEGCDRSCGFCATRASVARSAAATSHRSYRGRPARSP